MKNFLFILFQYCVPQHWLSRAVGKLATCETFWLKNWLISRFIAKYQVNMSEAEREDPTEYAHFNDFFTRALKPEARTLENQASQITSPADGAISQIGNIESGRIFQAKGHRFTCEELLGGDTHLAEKFSNGKFATIYLSPKDYHRVHMPVSGKLTKMYHIPGDLFSVNTTTATHVPNLFARNERVACVFETDLGPVVAVLVGAMIVASIDTVWAGQVAPTGKKVTEFDYESKDPIALEQGDEMGRFKLGSTVVLLFPENSIAWEGTLKNSSALRMGQAIATRVTKK